MKPSGPVETDIVLLGAGHAHVEVLRRFAMRPAPGVRLTLIGREPETPYSGMLPGLIRGEYTIEEAHIDLAPLAAAAGARLILGEATAIGLADRTVSIQGRPPVAFDLLSVDVGGVPKVPCAGGVAVKPIGQFLHRLEQLEAELRPGDRIAVVGGGPAGTELALALAARFAGRFRLLLVSQTESILPAAPDRARAVVERALQSAGIEVSRRVKAGATQCGRMQVADGPSLDAAAALWATGVEGPGFLADSGLACDPAGCVRVDATLRSISHPIVFAAGDCASLGGNPRPKAGVWAVRAGSPLAANLRRAARGAPLRTWRPQRDALVLLGLGHGRAVGWRNGMTVSGAWVWRVKDWIDRRWMRMYQTMRMPVDPGDPMRCGGCGAKVGAEVLAGALATLRMDAEASGPATSPAEPSSGPSPPTCSGSGHPQAHIPAEIAAPGLLIGLDSPDDAAVLQPPAGQLLVQSVDHFRAFLDDPYVFGQIAAAHALSDLHAMGARPWTALAVAAVPYAAGAKMRADLAAMLQGATRVLRGDGCALVGGHSAEGSDAELGFAVTGLADPGTILRKAGLRPGNALVMTKRLGTGIVLAGHMRGLVRAAWLLAAIESMRVTNATAVPILRAHGATACTDVTGFGLAGHLSEMLSASGVAARLVPDAVPALPGALALAAQGVESTLAPENRRMLPNRRDPLAALLTDPQTSGGLLAGIPAECGAACVLALRAAGIPASLVGTVIPPRGDGLLIDMPLSG